MTIAAKADITQAKPRPGYLLYGPVALFDTRGNALALHGRRLVALERPTHPLSRPEDEPLASDRAMYFG